MKMDDLEGRTKEYTRRCGEYSNVIQHIGADMDDVDSVRCRRLWIAPRYKVDAEETEFSEFKRWICAKSKPDSLIGDTLNVLCKIEQATICSLG